MTTTKRQKNSKNLFASINHFLSFFLCSMFIQFGICNSLGKEVLLNLHYMYNEDAVDSVELRKRLSENGISMITYIVDNNRSINEHANNVKKIISSYDRSDKLELVVLTDRMSTFVGLKLCNSMKDVRGLITISGAFNDGDDFIYSEFSVTKNADNFNKLSENREKERCLFSVWQIIQKSKKTKNITFTDNSADMQKMMILLKSEYGKSLLHFSLEKNLRKIDAVILPFYIYEYRKEYICDLDISNLMYIGNKNKIRYTLPESYGKRKIVSKIVEKVCEINPN